MLGFVFGCFWRADFSDLYLDVFGRADFSDLYLDVFGGRIRGTHVCLLSPTTSPTANACEHETCSLTNAFLVDILSPTLVHSVCELISFCCSLPFPLDLLIHLGRCCCIAYFSSLCYDAPV